MLQTVPRFDRLTVEADKLGGQVCVRGYRFTVEHLLQLLAGGWDLERIQPDFPFIESEDIQLADTGPIGPSGAAAARTGRPDRRRARARLSPTPQFTSWRRWLLRPAGSPS